MEQLGNLNYEINSKNHSHLKWFIAFCIMLSATVNAWGQNTIGNPNFLKQQAENGNVEAPYWLGELYYLGSEKYAESIVKYTTYQGQKVDVNYELASYWYQKGAERGSINCQFCIGRSYYFGYGVKQDFNKCLYWFEKALTKKDELRYDSWEEIAVSTVNELKAAGYSSSLK